MSLEDKIGELTAAVNALTAALSGSEVTMTSPAPAKAEVAPPKPKATPTPSTAGLTASTTNATTPDSGTKDATLTIDYAQVAKAITDTFKVDRVKTVAALAKFGAAKGPQLKPEDYAAFLKELTA